MLYVSTFVFTLPVMHETLANSERRDIHSLTSTCKEMHALVRRHFPYYSMHKVAQEDLKSEVVLFPEIYKTLKIRSMILGLIEDSGDVTMFNNLCQYTYQSMTLREVKRLLRTCINRNWTNKFAALLSALDDRFSPIYGKGWKKLCDNLTIMRGVYDDITSLTDNNQINYAQYVAIGNISRFPDYMETYKNCRYPEEVNPDFGRYVSHDILEIYLTQTSTSPEDTYKNHFSTIIEFGDLEKIDTILALGVRKPFTANIPSLNVFHHLLNADIDIRKSLLTTNNLDVLHIAYHYYHKGIIPDLTCNWSNRQKIYGNSDLEKCEKCRKIRGLYRKNIMTITAGNYDIDNILKQCEFYNIDPESLTLRQIYEMKSFRLMLYHMGKISKDRLQEEIKELKRHNDLIDKPWSLNMRVDTHYNEDPVLYYSEDKNNHRLVFEIMADNLHIFSSNILEYSLHYWRRWMRYTRKSTFEVIQYIMRHYIRRDKSFVVSTLLIWLIENPIHCKESEKEVLRNIRSQMCPGNFNIWEIVKHVDFTLH